MKTAAAFIVYSPRFAVIAACFLFACTNKKPQSAVLFTLLNNDSTGIRFRNDVTDSKEDNSFLFRNFYNGGGVALGDINNDGLPDVFLTSNQGDNKLYLNKGSLQFQDISVQAGLKQDSMWSTGVTMADVNADGWLDVYVCSSGNIKKGRRQNKLYINQQNNQFKEEGARYGLDVSGYCTQASFFDYDSDGDLDCFIINNSPIPFSSLNYADMRDVEIDKWKGDSNLKGGGNHLYRNNSSTPATSSQPVFTEVTAAAGLHTGLISFGLGVSVGDVNNDGYPDIYVGNDFIEKDYLYINQKNGTFRDELESRLQKISMSSMSTDLADINNDGHPEIFTTDMIPDDDYRLKTTGTFDNIDLYLSKQKAGLYHQYVRNCLQLNNGDGSFSEVGNYCGVYGTDWSWGSVFFDADNDGRNDLFVCNGIAKDVGDLDFLDFFSNDVYSKMVETGQRMEMDELLKHIPTTPLANRVFKNKSLLQFEDVSSRWGFSQPSFSNSIAYADLDNDGDLDLVLNNENSPASVYRNNSRQQTGNNFISIGLSGTGANLFAIGSKLKLYVNGEVIYRELSPVRGFQSCMEYKQTIGLGRYKNFDSLVVTWPGRTTSVYKNLAVNKLHILQQTDKAIVLNEGLPGATFFTRSPSVFDRHTEDEFVDFYYERNLPQGLSRQGPLAATGDVNGDGLEDIYIGGAREQAGQLYLQTAAGGFQKREQAAFTAYKDFEDVASLFFDADGDGDLDLFIGSGGNFSQPGSRTTEHRLYKNDGRGNFDLDPAAFPSNPDNISVATASDYDGDGDQDLFVGSRSVPFSYGQTPRSYLYQNNGRGQFKDVTMELGAAIATIGMVTSATWANVTGDAKPELIITGEWMATRLFTYNTNRFEEVTNTGLQNMSGWWQRVVAADVNADGKQDLIIGNVGENFYLRPATNQPVKLWVADFDGNGNVDQFLTQTINGKDMPVFLKRDITEQFPALKKENLKNVDYARKTIQELFDKKLLNGAVVKSFNYCASVVAINKGNGSFVITPLPVRFQLSSINAICVADVNNDGAMDLITGGNLFTFPPQFGRLDASYGDVALNDGKGNFTLAAAEKTGFGWRGEVKDIRPVQVKNSTAYLVTQNNGQPLLYSLRK